jgi:hypothetical protein
MSLDDLLAIDEVLGKLAVHAPEKAELVKLRFYGHELSGGSPRDGRVTRNCRTILDLCEVLALRAAS